MAALPTTNLSFSQINQQLSRTLTSKYLINDVEGRTLASVGNTGQSVTPGTEVRLSRFRGHARANITAASTTTNVNLFTITSSVNYTAGSTYVSYTIPSNVTIGSSSTSTSAITIIGFSSGDVVEIVNNGYIVGKGGNGGNGGYGAYVKGHAGSNGGTAITTTASTKIVNNGYIWAGGGGGNGGDGGESSGGEARYGGGGGGGAGFDPGIGGSGAGTAKDGTLTTGGIGGAQSFATLNVFPGRGGNGGNPGANGNYGYKGGNVAIQNTVIPASAGNSIVGYSNVQYSGSGSLLGLTAA